MKPNGNIISLKNVSMVFGKQVVLRGLDFALAQGQTAVVLGRSGTGKSVLLKLIVGLMRPTTGQVFFKGQDINLLAERKRSEVQTHMGVLFQGAALFDSMTVFENVAFGLRESRRYSEADIHRIVLDRLAMVGMADTVEKKPSELSGGMKKRVGLARAIAMDPEVLLYDEPTTGLDPITSDTINELIVRTRKTMGTTSVVVTHDLTSARKVGDRMLLLQDGKFVFDGTPQEMDNSSDPRVRRFIEGRSTEVA